MGMAAQGDCLASRTYCSMILGNLKKRRILRKVLKADKGKKINIHRHHVNRKSLTLTS